ncbi:MAG: hypothetical protein ACLQHS_02075 [Candidatus Limnocylindrales bacterium]
MTAQIGMPVTDDDWGALVGIRRRQIARFLTWAVERERVESLRLANRGDVARVRRITDAFGEPWWAAVVYSCFDSEVGTLAVAHAFHDPVSAREAERLLLDIVLPRGAVQHHRTQPGHRGAKVALVSACARVRDFERILKTEGGFHGRYDELRSLRAKQWGRTTCYDLLVRTGQLKIGSVVEYAPDRAYLAESTGPRKGFHLIWGIEVTRSNVAACEALLHRWGEQWQRVADQVGVPWTGEPYGPGDFENALCIFQERRNHGYGITS